jgi:hypothetical protein
MKKKILLSIFLFFGLQIVANTGGATFKPGLIGDPFVWQLTNISVAKENLSFRFFERDSKKVCAFTAIYFMECDTNQTFPVSCIFYGVRSSNIQIFYNEERAADFSDSANFKAVDKLLFDEINERNHHAIWSDWRTLTKKGFAFTFNPKQQNVIKITGEITLEPTQIWYAVNSSSIFSRHPFLNKKAGKYDEILHYLITPIETWKSVGEIEVNVEYPKNWDLNFEMVDEKLIKRSKEKDKISCNLIFKDSLPQILTISIPNKQLFFVGGPTIGFYKTKKTDFFMKYGWEFGINHAFYLSTIIALEYETNYSNFHQFCFSVIPSLPMMSLLFPSVGLGIGVPLRIENKQVYSGIRLRSDFAWGLFVVNLNWDFIPKIGIENSKNRYYGFSL